MVLNDAAVVVDVASLDAGIDHVADTAMWKRVASVAVVALFEAGDEFAVAVAVAVADRWVLNVPRTFAEAVVVGGGGSGDGSGDGCNTDVVAQAARNVPAATHALNTAAAATEAAAVAPAIAGVHAQLRPALFCTLTNSAKEHAASNGLSQPIAARALDDRFLYSMVPFS